MARFTSLVAGEEIPAPEEDFRAAERVEQYRLGAQALYIPAGLRWSYIPLAAVTSAEESHRVISAGKCVAVEERRPVLQLNTAVESFKLSLERPESLKRLLDAVQRQ